MFLCIRFINFYDWIKIENPLASAKGLSVISHVWINIIGLT